jgi:hypothetical protein
MMHSQESTRLLGFVVVKPALSVPAFGLGVGTIAPGIMKDELLLSYPTLRAEDLVNTWAYVRSHRAEIEEDIRENEDV